MVPNVFFKVNDLQLYFWSLTVVAFAMYCKVSDCPLYSNSTVGISFLLRMSSTEEKTVSDGNTTFREAEISKRDSTSLFFGLRKILILRSTNVLTLFRATFCNFALGSLFRTTVEKFIFSNVYFYQTRQNCVRVQEGAYRSSWYWWERANQQTSIFFLFPVEDTYKSVLISFMLIRGKRNKCSRGTLWTSIELARLKKFWKKNLRLSVKLLFFRTLQHVNWPIERGWAIVKHSYCLFCSFFLVFHFLKPELRSLFAI